MGKPTIILDPGHGGLDQNGNYVTAPRKMHTFKDGTVNYEGVTNRRIAFYLKQLLESNGFEVVLSVDDHEDKSLSKRVKEANALLGNKLFISIHGNASPKHNASGLEIWTSKGQTNSDVLAEFISKQWKYNFPELKFRSDTEDGDLDKESQFYVLRKTTCPAVLLEILFFDNKKDALLLREDRFLRKIALSTFEGIVKHVNKQLC